MNNEIKMGVYEHYKGNKYLVIGLAKHSETLEDMIVYIPLYFEKDGPSRIWVRPLSMWNEEIDWEGKKIRRFTYIGER